MKMELRLALIPQCAQCGHFISVERKDAVAVLVKLLGLASGWRLCRCRQMIYRTRGEPRGYFDPLRSDEWKRRRENDGIKTTCETKGV